MWEPNLQTNCAITTGAENVPGTMTKTVTNKLWPNNRTLGGLNLVVAFNMPTVNSPCNSESPTELAHQNVATTPQTTSGDANKKKLLGKQKFVCVANTTNPINQTEPNPTNQPTGTRKKIRPTSTTTGQPITLFLGTHTHTMRTHMQTHPHTHPHAHPPRPSLPLNGRPTWSNSHGKCANIATLTIFGVHALLCGRRSWQNIALADWRIFPCTRPLSNHCWSHNFDPLTFLADFSGSVNLLFWERDFKMFMDRDGHSQIRWTRRRLPKRWTLQIIVSNSSCYPCTNCD